SASTAAGCPRPCAQAATLRLHPEPLAVTARGLAERDDLRQLRPLCGGQAQSNTPARSAKPTPGFRGGPRPRRAPQGRLIVHEIIASDRLGTSSILVPKPPAIARKLGRFPARQECPNWSGTRPETS